MIGSAPPPTTTPPQQSDSPLAETWSGGLGVAPEMFVLSSSGSAGSDNPGNGTPNPTSSHPLNMSVSLPSQSNVLLLSSSNL